MVWPLAIFLIALIFRKDVSVALGRIGQVKYRDLELTFREDLHNAEQLARSIPPAAGKASVLLEVADDESRPLVGRLIVSPSPSEESRSDSTAPVAMDLGQPREAIEAAWVHLTRSLARSSKRKKSPASTNPKVDAVVSLLRTLRDRAARPELPEPSAEDARRFVELANRIASRIEEVG